MDAFRAINEIVFAVLFVVAVGLGPFAGVMALFVHTTGILAKLFSEAVEAIDHRPVEGIRATGDPARARRRGGIGQVLFESIRGFYYAETAALLITIVVTVALVDLISQQLRRW